MRFLPLALLPSLVLAADASAATRAFAETYEARTGAEGDAQIETWIDDDHTFGSWTVWRFWWGGTASITDALEVSIYLTAAQQGAVNQPSLGLALETAYFFARYRFLGTGGEGFSLLGQLQYILPLMPDYADQQTYDYLDHANTFGERLVASYQKSRFLASANLLVDELLLQSSTGGANLFGVAKYTAGAAFAILPPGPRGPPLTVGLEVFGDFPFARSGIGAIWWPGGFPVAVGPAVSVAFGRFWATASWGYAPGGVLHDTPAPGQSGSYTATEGVGRLIAAFEF